VEILQLHALRSCLHNLAYRTVSDNLLWHHLFPASFAELNSQLITPRMAAISHQPPGLLFTGWLSTN
jgi:hypothetical protein